MADQNSTAGATTTTDAAAPLSPLFPNLPDDISLLCIARVPRAYHSTLSAVSRSWRATIRSPELSKIRSLLLSTQQSLYFNIGIGNSFCEWYLLIQSPNCPTFLSPLPPLKNQPDGSSFAVLGPKIYVISGLVDDIPINDVWIFDCRSSTWETGPKLIVGREFPATAAVNGKIYVIGGYAGDDNVVNSMNWIEVFDPEIGVWKTVESGFDAKNWLMTGIVVGNRIYALNNSGFGLIYDTVTGEWTSISESFFLDYNWSDQVAVVDGVMYFYDVPEMMRGYDVERGVWYEIKGVDNGLFNGLNDGSVVSLNGSLCVVWERMGSMKTVEIMCTEIEVWKDVDGGGGVSGSVLRSNMILRGPYNSYVVQCLSV